VASRFFRFRERSDAHQVTADLGVTLAAVAGQEGEEAAGAGIVGCVENLPLAAPGAQQARPIELLDVERKGCRRDADPRRDLPGRQTARARGHEQPENREPGLMSERRQRRERRFLFHHSLRQIFDA
jgi:hypothetical protein